MKESELSIMSITKAIESIPASAWNRVAGTICETFEKLVSPVIELTSGSGRVIKACFENLLPPEKVVVTQTVALAMNKVRQSDAKRFGNMKPKILIDCIKASESQTDPTIQALWANLLAQESLYGNVHPTVTEILGRLCAADAQLLASIAERQRGETKNRLMLKLFATAVGVHTDLEADKASFSHFRLEELKLVTRVEPKKIWLVTTEGWLFIKCVTDPSLQATTEAKSNQR